jgi:hypothetical protein
MSTTHQKKLTMFTSSDTEARKIIDIHKE